MRTCVDCDEFVACPNNECYYGWCDYFSNWVAESDPMCQEAKDAESYVHGDDVYDAMMDSKEE